MSTYVNQEFMRGEPVEAPLRRPCLCECPCHANEPDSTVPLPFPPAYVDYRQHSPMLDSNWMPLGAGLEPASPELWNEASQEASRQPEFHSPKDSSTVARAPAWLQVLGCFLLSFNTWGFFLSFGIFQDYYQKTYLSGFAPSAVSWIGTVQGFLLVVVGIVTGPLFDLGYMRTLLGAGTALVFVGFLVASEARGYFEIFLSVSILSGLGSGCLFVPSVAIVAQWFPAPQRALATGIAAAGGAFGGVVIPIVFKAALDAFGYGWAVRTLAFLSLATLFLSSLLLRTRHDPTSHRTLRTIFDPAVFGDARFVFFSLALFFSFTGLYIPFYYLPSYAKDELGVSDTLTFGILSVMNTGAVFGRGLPGLVAGYFGPVNSLAFAMFISGIIHVCWVVVHTLPGLLAFGALYGLFAGAVVSLPMSAFTELWPDVNEAGTRFGLSYSFAGFGILVGNPIAGILISNFGYQSLQVFGGLAIMFGFLSACIAALV